MSKTSVLLDELDPARAAEAAGARLELERRMANERSRYYAPNGRLEDFLQFLKPFDARGVKVPIGVLRGGNHSGKTSLMSNLASYLGDRINNPYFDKIPYLRDFRRPNRGRIFTTANAAQTTYPDEFTKWLPKGHVKRELAGRKFDSYFTFTRTGSEFDMLTFDQDPNVGESLTLDWLLIDEVLPQKFWTGLRSRFRRGGLIIFGLTALEGSGWLHDVLEVPERIGKDVFPYEVSSHDNCKQCGVRGVMEHEALESQEQEYDDTELAARRHGKYLHLSGVVYQSYRTGYVSNNVDGSPRIVGHEMPALEGYYRECWDKKLYTLYNCIDPHDRKPFAIAWFAVFPNEDVVGVAEWPDESMPMFHKIKNWSWSPREYAEMIHATELAIGKPADVRIMDPFFGNAPKANGPTVAQLMKTAGEEIKYALRYAFPPALSLQVGHLKVKTLLGNPAVGIRPKFFLLPHMRNTKFAFTHYGYKENTDKAKGLSEEPELVHKDFADLPRFLAARGARYLKKVLEAPAQELYKPREHATGYRGL